MGLPQLADSRAMRRNRVCKRGTILLGAQFSEIDCILCDFHEHGAELKAPQDTFLPGEFLLYVPQDDKAYRCRLAWRRKDRIGVEISGAEPKPRWQYGRAGN